jgi:hypothetical protein
MLPKYPWSGQSGWGVNPEEDAAQRLKVQQEHARLNAIPEYRKHREDRIWLQKLLMDLLFDERREFVFPERPQPKVVHSTGRRELKATKPCAYDVDYRESLAYMSFKQERRTFSIALTHYSNEFRTSRWDKDRHDRKYAHARLGAYTMNALKQGFKRAEMGHDVGSSLYLYQQMHDRKLSTSSALSRAAWLVKNAPLRKPVPETLIPRGKWQRIQEHWRDYYPDSHYWAAMAATTKSPLLFKEDLLFDFICDVDVDLFQKIANSFVDFRIRVVPPKISKVPMYLKQGLALYEIEENPLAEIPNALEDFQWEALSRYPTASK